jgi:hypothetical protein
MISLETYKYLPYPATGKFSTDTPPPDLEVYFNTFVPGKMGSVPIQILNP